MTKVFAIFDKVASVYSPIFTAANDEVAKRNCSSMVNTTGNTYSDFPQDFALYCIASFADSALLIPSGMCVEPSDNSIVGRFAPVHVVDFDQLVASK